MPYRPSPARRGSVPALITALSLAIGALATPVGAYPRPGLTEMVTVAIEGQADGYSHEPRLSDDGRFVIYQSASTNLVPGDTNGQTDIYLRDLQEGVTRRLNVAADGTQANFNTGNPSVSPSGRYVSFSSMADNLFPGDANATWDALVKDVGTGAVLVGSVATDGAQGNGISAAPVATAMDAGLIAFESDATNLVPDDTNGARDIFVHDFITGITTRVSTTASGAQADGASVQVSISADGRYVAFASSATNLVPGDTNARTDSFVKDLVTGAIRRVSLTNRGTEANLGGGGPILNADGSVVLWSSPSNDIVPADGNAGGNQFGILDAFVTDLATGIVERVSVSSDGVEGNGVSGGHSISNDGRYVTFGSGASNLVPGDTNVRTDMFLHDRVTGITERVSVNADGSQATGGLFGSSRAVVSPDGSLVAFASDNPNIVEGDTGLGFDSDIFVRRRGPALGVSELRVERDGGDLVVEGRATFSGGVAAVASDAVTDGEEVLGAELTGASVILRPENEDLQVRILVSSLPGVRPPSTPPNQPGAALSGIAGTPAVIHAFGFSTGGKAYEVRVLRTAVSAAPPGAPFFALYECQATCLEVARLAGGYGTVGEEIRFSIPLSTIAVTGPATLTAVDVRVGVGEAATGVVHLLDQLILPSVNLTPPRVDLALAPEGQPEDQVAFEAVPVTTGAFSTRLAHPPGAAPAPMRLWTRACLADECHASSIPAPD